MVKLVLLIALCVEPALAAATHLMKTPFTVEGKVYCDTYRAGYETKTITYITSAKVRLECKDKSSMALVYTKEGTTDSAGCYKIPVTEDHLDQFWMQIQAATVLISLCKENELRGNLFQDRVGEVGVGERELGDGQQ